MLRLVTPAEADAIEAIREARSDSESIPWAVATLCADCETVHNQPGGACPRCTSAHGILLSRLLGSRS